MQFLLIISLENTIRCKALNPNPSPSLLYYRSNCRVLNIEHHDSCMEPPDSTQYIRSQVPAARQRSSPILWVLGPHLSLGTDVLYVDM